MGAVRLTASGPSLQPTFVAVNVLLIGFAALTVALRVLARKIKTAKLGWDDYTMFLALACATALVSANLVACHYGIGKHITNVTTDDLIKLAKAFYAAQFLWVASMATLKISIVILYKRIFGVVDYFRISSYIIGIFTVIWAFTNFMVLVFECKPMTFHWDPNVHGTCIDRPTFYKLSTASNVATDIALLVIPMPSIWKMNASFWHRLQLSALFLTGLLTCAVSLARFAALFKLEGRDVTWDVTTSALWIAAEPCFGIMAACLSTVRPVVRLISEKIWSRREETLKSDYTRRSPIRPNNGLNERHNNTETSYEKHRREAASRQIV